jgi:hypothetical protein
MNELGLRLAAMATAMACLIAPAFGAPQSISARLNQEYANADNLRAFAIHAKARPSEGGVFYARYAVDNCGRDLVAIKRAADVARGKEIKATGTVASHRLALGDRFLHRCGAFTPGEASAMYQDLSAIPGSYDPLLAADRDMLNAAFSRRPDLIRAAVAKLIEIDDPLLWTHHRLFELMAMADPEARRVTGICFGGVVYAPDGGELKEAASALQLGFCRAGTACAKDDELLVVCAIGGACAPDLETKEKDLYMANDGTAEGWRRVLELTQQIRDALASKNVGFFVR